MCSQAQFASASGRARAGAVEHSIRFSLIYINMWHSMVTCGKLIDLLFPGMTDVFIRWPQVMQLSISFTSISTHPRANGWRKGDISHKIGWPKMNNEREQYDIWWVRACTCTINMCFRTLLWRTEKVRSNTYQVGPQDSYHYCQHKMSHELSLCSILSKSCLSSYHYFQSWISSTPLLAYLSDLFTPRGPQFHQCGALAREFVLIYSPCDPHSYPYGSHHL